MSTEAILQGLSINNINSSQNSEVSDRGINGLKYFNFNYTNNFNSILTQKYYNPTSNYLTLATVVSWCIVNDSIAVCDLGQLSNATTTSSFGIIGSGSTNSTNLRISLTLTAGTSKYLNHAAYSSKYDKLIVPTSITQVLIISGLKTSAPTIKAITRTPSLIVAINPDEENSDYIYMFGTAAGAANFVKFDISTETFTNIATVPANLGAITTRVYQYFDGYIYAIGSGGTTSYSYRYDVEGDAWETLLTYPTVTITNNSFLNYCRPNKNSLYVWYVAGAISSKVISRMNILTGEIINLDMPIAANVNSVFYPKKDDSGIFFSLNINTGNETNLYFISIRNTLVRIPYSFSINPSLVWEVNNLLTLGYNSSGSGDNGSSTPYLYSAIIRSVNRIKIAELKLGDIVYSTDNIYDTQNNLYPLLTENLITTNTDFFTDYYYQEGYISGWVK